MILQDVLLPEFIKVDIEAEEKDDAFVEMINFYCQADNNDDREDILNAIRMRELKMSTGIKKGIAVPHGQTNAVNKLRGVLGISRKGVQYDSLDGEPVHLLFMIISPIEDSGIHLRLLRHLAEIMDIPQFQRELQSQEDPQGAFKVIKKYEEMFNAQN
jgi:PTS system fructose-specific IIC component/PTS system nitrogen regulatory IIA component